MVTKMSNNKIAVILVRGLVNISPDVKKTLELLKRLVVLIYLKKRLNNNSSCFVGLGPCTTALGSRILDRLSFVNTHEKYKV